MSVITVNYSDAQNTTPKNPFTLVYGGAITENTKGQVNIHPVTYKIKDIWKQTDAENKEVIWKYLNLLVAINNKIARV